jgi:hypothetical protein
MPLEAVVVLRIKPASRAAWDTMKNKIKTFIQNNPEVTLDQPVVFQETDAAL